MTKIALTAAAILVATGTAFAGSDNYGSNNVNQPVANQSVSNIDTSHTGSILEVRKGTGRRQCQRAGPVWPGHLGSLISESLRPQRAVGSARRSCFLRLTPMRRRHPTPKFANLQNISTPGNKTGLSGVLSVAEPSSQDAAQRKNQET